MKALIYPDSIIHVYRKSEELGMSVKVGSPMRENSSLPLTDFTYLVPL